MALSAELWYWCCVKDDNGGNVKEVTVISAECR